MKQARDVNSLGDQPGGSAWGSARGVRLGVSLGVSPGQRVSLGVSAKGSLCRGSWGMAKGGDGKA